MIHTEPALYGYLAEFETPEQLIDASAKTHQEGFYEIDAYSPFPIHELEHALGYGPSRVSLFVLCGGIFGLVAGFSLLYFTSVIDYPINVGGRPLNSIPSFIPIMFETTVLCAVFAAVFGMFWLNELPKPYHPVFNVARFALASKDRFFLLIKSSDKRFDPLRTKEFLEALGPKGVYAVPS